VGFEVVLGNRVAVRLKNSIILFDPKVADFFSFVSHSHIDHSPYHVFSPIYATKETIDLLRVADPFLDAKEVKLNKWYDFDDFRVKFLSAGHILGSSQILVEIEGKSILYSGDISLESNPTCRPIGIEQADILIVEATYGNPNFILPRKEEVVEKFLKWVRKRLFEGKRVIIGAYQIGKSQEVIKILNEEGIVPKVTETIRRYSEVYKKNGVKLEFTSEESDVLIKPIQLIRKNEEACVMTGWVNFGFFNTFGFPLSDHADFNQLLEFVELVCPKKVICIHGYAKELAHSIRKKLGINAVSLLGLQKFKIELE